MLITLLLSFLADSDVGNTDTDPHQCKCFKVHVKNEVCRIQWINIRLCKLGNVVAVNETLGSDFAAMILS